MIKQKRGQHTNPLPLKSAAAVAFSVGGILYTYVRRIKINQSKSLKPPSPPCLDIGECPDSCIDIDDKHVLYNSTSVTPEKQAKSPLSKSPMRSRLSDNCSTCAKPNGGNDMNTKEHKCTEKDGNISEQEISSLRNTVNILKEREKNLEIQLLKYYGLKEQETAVMELQNRLKINNMEAKLFTHQIESLESDKRRLEEQVADQAKVSTALEDAKTKIKLLKKKLRSDAEQTREQISALQERVANLQEDEEENMAANQLDIRQNLQRIKELEDENNELKKSINSLKLENSELTQKLDYVNLIATTVLDDDEKTAVEECQRLRQEKQDLSKEIDRLQADHRSDIEELVYLRWLNACMHNRLRNQMTHPGLNATISPESDEKSTSGRQSVCVTDSGEDSQSIDLSSSDKPQPIRTKAITKFMRLVRGKSHDNRSPRSNCSPRTTEETSAYIEDMMVGYLGYSSGNRSGVSTLTDNGPDGMYSPRSSSQCSRLSS